MQDEKGVTDFWSDDFMGRKPSAEFLTTYLLANPHVKVLNINSPWGAGKSFFLERWARSLQEKHVCVCFNAWETDYSAEPLIALISCIEQQVTDPLALESTKVGKGLVNVSSKLIKHAAPLILKGLVRKVSGVELDDLVGEGAEESADGIIKALIEEQAKTKENVEGFKEEVKARLNRAAMNEGKIAPAFIFIDELDRCRPTYAIELLERIKHFFELEDCRFIIASDTVQLAHSIRAVYGQGFSSERYLNRFFDAEFKLNNADLFGMVHHSLPEITGLNLGVNISGVVSADFTRYSGAVAREPDHRTVVSETNGFTENELILVGLSKYFKVELREMVNYIKQIKSAADSIGGAVHFFWLAFLIFFKSSDPERYQSLFIKDKGAVAMRDYNKERAFDVNFSFSYALVSVADLAQLYIDAWGMSRDEMHAVVRDYSRWQQTIMHDLSKNFSAFRTYKDIIELAYRLS